MSISYVLAPVIRLSITQFEAALRRAIPTLESYHNESTEEGLWYFVDACFGDGARGKLGTNPYINDFFTIQSSNYRSQDGKMMYISGEITHGENGLETLAELSIQLDASEIEMEAFAREFARQFCEVLPLYLESAIDYLSSPCGPDKPWQLNSLKKSE